MAELRVDFLAKSFGAQHVLRGVDLLVRPGRLVAILGGSGSGKTTLLRLIAGFEHADAGIITIGGRRVTGPGVHLQPEQRAIGYVAQEGALFPHLSVAANITFGLPRRERRAQTRVGELLELVGLPASFAMRAPHQLSGGEQQRVALARALAPDPALVLLDEPFSALDASLRVETRAAVAAALAGAGATAVLVTHDQAEALSMGHEVAVLRAGALVQVDTPRSLYRRPVDPELARFVGEAVILPGFAQSGWASCRLGRLRLAPGIGDGPVEVMIRPEQIRLTPDVVDGIEAKIVDLTYYGHDCSVRLSVGDGTELTALVPGHAPLRPGETVALSVQAEVMAYPR